MLLSIVRFCFYFADVVRTKLSLLFSQFINLYTHHFDLFVRASSLNQLQSLVFNSILLGFRLLPIFDSNTI